VLADTSSLIEPSPHESRAGSAAIAAGIKPGRKVNEVRVDETAQRPLLLPLGDLFGGLTEAGAMRFFNGEGGHLVAAGGALHPHRTDRTKLTEYYRARRGLESVQGPAAPSWPRSCAGTCAGTGRKPSRW
jgi:hypothetical protein